MSLIDILLLDVSLLVYSDISLERESGALVSNFPPNLLRRAIESFFKEDRSRLLSLNAVQSFLAQTILAATIGYRLWLGQSFFQFEIFV